MIRTEFTRHKPAHGSDKSFSAPMTAAKAGARRAAARQQTRRECRWVRATNSFTTACQARISGTTGRSTRGSSSASGTLSRHCKTLITSLRAWKMPRYSNRKTGARPGRSYQDCANTIPAQSGSQAQVECVCTRFSSIKRIRDEYPSQSPPRAPFVVMTAAKRGSQSIEVCTRNSCPIQRQR